MPLLRQLLIHRGADLFQGKWLYDDAVDQRLQIMGPLPFAGIAGHQQDLHLRIILAGLQCERDAVEFGHDDVGQQQVEASAGQGAERGGAVRNRRHIVTGMAQRTRDEGAYRRVILRHQDPRHGHPEAQPPASKVTTTPVAASLGCATLVRKGTLAPGGRRSSLTVNDQDCSSFLLPSCKITLSFGTARASFDTLTTLPCMTSVGSPFSVSRLVATSLSSRSLWALAGARPSMA